METIRKKKECTFYNVDKELLKEELAKRGENLSSASAGIGYTNSYLSQMLSPAQEARGKKIGIPKRSMMLLYEKFNILPESIIRPEPVLEVVEDPQEEPQTEQPQPFAMDWAQLYNTIYAATLAAMRQALKGE